MENTKKYVAVFDLPDDKDWNGQKVELSNYTHYSILKEVPEQHDIIFDDERDDYDLGYNQALIDLRIID